MAIDVRWDAMDEVWILTTSEDLDVAEVVTLIRGTDWKGARRFLWDFRDLVRGPDAPPDLRRMLDEVQRTLETWVGSRVAMLATTDFHFGIARMYTAFAGDIDIDFRAFRSEAEARAWLTA